MELPESRGNIAPLLVGSYEEELHRVLEELIKREPQRIINVGCAEGYYAVGLARRLPAADVHAFDIDELAQELTRATAESNGVSGRVEVSSVCSAHTLEQLLTSSSLLLVDCEGCEVELLRPDLAPSLRVATLLVELHDFVTPEISTVVLARFRDTHSIEVITAGARRVSDYPMLQQLDLSDRSAALFEPRPADPHPMQWAVMRPLAERD